MPPKSPNSYVLFDDALNETLEDATPPLPENLREAANTPSTAQVNAGLSLKLDKAQNLADLTDSGAARDNLGLGTAALNDEEDFAAANHTHSDATTSAAGFMAAADKVKLDAIEAGADVTDAGNVGSAIHGADAKTTPVDADTVALIDSAASNVLKKLSWSNIKATLESYFDTLYAAASHSHSDATTSAAGFMSAADKTKLDGIEAGADVTNKDNVEAALNDAEAKSTPVDADALALLDSEDDDKLKLVTVSDLKSVIGGGGDVAGDTHAASAKATPVDADEFPLVDSADSWALKKWTFANIKSVLKTYFDTLYGNVVGPVTSTTNNAVAGFDGTSGKQIKQLSDSQIRTAAGLSTSDSPQFTALNIGHASDTTLARVSAGVISVEGKRILTGSEENQPVTGGATVTSKDLGTQSSGTLTLDVGDCALQHYTNNGAHTLAPGTVTGAAIIDITNGASAGAITTSGWTKVSGDSFTTTNGHKFRCHASVGNAGSLLVVQAMQ